MEVQFLDYITSVFSWLGLKIKFETHFSSKTLECSLRVLVIENAPPQKNYHKISQILGRFHLKYG